MKMHNAKSHGTPIDLLKLILENKKISLSKVPVAIIYLLRSILDYPLMIYEDFFLFNKIRSTHIVDDPIFILGHYRSGTTLLYKYLASDIQFGYVSDYDQFFPFHTNSMQSFLKPIIQKLFKLLKVKQVFFNDYCINLDDPNEDEGFLINSLSPISAYWGYIFPRNAEKYLDRNIFFADQDAINTWKELYLYNLQKIAYNKNKKRLIIKNPPNTARIPVLLELFPNAKFVFIYRNPYNVFCSMEKLWKDCIEKYFSLQKLGNIEREHIIFSHYNKLMHAYEKDKNMLTKKNLIEVKYEELIDNPLPIIKSIYDRFNLPNFNDIYFSIIKRIKKEEKYKMNKYYLDKNTIDKINSRFKYFINKYNYTQPN